MRRGDGVPQDFAEAVKWYNKAAVQGHASAQSNLGVMYVNGHGVSKDYTEAVKWYSKAAEQGDASAQFNLGDMHANGHGISKDFVFAYMWWNHSASQGNESAKKNKDIVSKLMTEEQIAEAQKLSREWLAKHSERNK